MSSICARRNRISFDQALHYPMARYFGRSTEHTRIGIHWRCWTWTKSDYASCQHIIHQSIRCVSVKVSVSHALKLTLKAKRDSGFPLSPYQLVKMVFSCRELALEEGRSVAPISHWTRKSGWSRVFLPFLGFTFGNLILWFSRDYLLKTRENMQRRSGTLYIRERKTVSNLV